MATYVPTGGRPFTALAALAYDESWDALDLYLNHQELCPRCRRVDTPGEPRSRRRCSEGSALFLAFQRVDRRCLRLVRQGR